MPGWPRIPPEHIAFIRRITTDQPSWGGSDPEELAIKLAIWHSTSTIRPYVVRRREPTGGCPAGDTAARAAFRTARPSRAASR